MTVPSSLCVRARILMIQTGFDEGGEVNFTETGWDYSLCLRVLELVICFNRQTECIIKSPKARSSHKMAKQKKPIQSPQVPPESPASKAARLRHYEMAGLPPSGPTFPQLSEKEKQAKRDALKRPIPGFKY